VHRPQVDAIREKSSYGIPASLGLAGTVGPVALAEFRFNSFLPCPCVTKPESARVDEESARIEFAWTSRITNGRRRGLAPDFKGSLPGARDSGARRSRHRYLWPPDRAMPVSMRGASANRQASRPGPDDGPLPGIARSTGRAVRRSGRPGPKLPATDAREACRLQRSAQLQATPAIRRAFPTTARPGKGNRTRIEAT